MTMSVNFNPHQIPDYLELDLLGHGIARVPGNDYYVLVLEKQRMEKQLAFIKNFSEREEDQ